MAVDRSSRRTFLRGVGVVAVGSAVLPAAPASAGEAIPAGAPPSISKIRNVTAATVDRIQRETVTVTLDRSGVVMSAPPEDFQPGWEFFKGDKVILTERTDGTFVVHPLVLSSEGPLSTVTNASVTVGALTGDLRDPSVALVVEEVSHKDEIESSVMALYVENGNRALRCFGVRP